MLQTPLYIHDVLNVIKLVFEMVNVKFFRMSNENNLIVVLCNIFAAFKLKYQLYREKKKKKKLLVQFYVFFFNFFIK